MVCKKKIFTTFTIILFVVFGIAAIQPLQYQERNLKVLPQDISDAKLDSIMHTYNKALGVECNFCHVKKNTDNFDYASDAKPMKENARTMMRMTIEINKTYFYFDKNIQPEYLNTVSCKTCHHGIPYPVE